ncbi:PKD domain-containing protein [Aestuariibaculum marinum]|uniref:PKD domain-containing protein n=1 Tax=Aestuariibaculum marinum TaxID=2683592 RepID=A0A8J6PSS2_9FLAO|nr:PKD domain-containing protein [Aestuariibaculum marinum]MBD0822496.1 PKD domain-containing protein [Aestuariibaculum marinum]
MKTLKYILIPFCAVLFFMVSCQDEDLDIGDITTPTNIQIDVEIIGVDVNNPNGDGTGFVKFSAKADKAITYIYNFGDDTDNVVSTGETMHRFTQVGVNSYTVTVIASGTGGTQSSKSMVVEVYSSFEDQEAKDFLSGGPGTSKTWYWAADKPVNIGLGPNEVSSGGEHRYPAWFQSNAWHSDKLCMYDAEMVFTQSADGALTYEQTVGNAYIPGTYAGNLGVDGDTCHGADVVPSLVGIKNVQLVPSTSIATIDQDDPDNEPYRGTTINFSDGGFMSWYVGSSSFEIIEITDSTLEVRVTEPGYAWYCVFQTEKPVQP